MTTTEPRALTAALSAPAFVTRGGGLAMHVANRHVERWAPEASASKLRPLRNLGFVDRLVSPWVEAAQRSTSLRWFSESISSGPLERPASHTSWVFPRPWYQDELDWMAAARQVSTQAAVEPSAAPSMFTTRGTFVAPAQPHARVALPTLLHEYVAPSLSVARPSVEVTADAYSPLVPFAATQAAQVMARAVAPLGGAKAARMSPGLRAVLTTLLERAASAPAESTPTRASLDAPALVTPPAPRADAPAADEATPALEVAERYAEQHAQIAELQRLARAAAERELAARHAARTAETRAVTESQLREIRAAQERAVAQREAARQQRLGEAAQRDAERAERDRARSSERDAAAAAERARIEERIAQRLAAARQHEAQHRLHEQAREAAARDAREAALAPAAAASGEQPRPETRESRIAGEIAAAVAALPPELSALVTASIGERPERAVRAIAELGEALRSVELIARTTATGGAIEPTRGPRLVLPAGLGGLVATVERTAGEPGPRQPAARPVVGAMPVASRVPALPFLRPQAGGAPTSALAAAMSATPAALHHVAWSDRWLARFAGAQPQSLATLSAALAAPAGRMQLLASEAPASVFVAPVEERTAPAARGDQAPDQSVVCIDDDDATPDEMFAAIAQAASRARTGAATPAAPPVAAPPAQAVEPDRLLARETLADLVAHGAPAAPGAGLSAQLASSPFAASLRHVLPLGRAPSFDVRALFGASLSTTYLSGALEPAIAELPVAAGDLEMPVVAPRAAGAEEGEAYTTLRSALLSWDVETAATGGAASEPASAAPARVASPAVTAARTLIDSLALPMLGEGAALGEPAAARPASYAAPGMIGDRAQAWSVAQERSAADLAFDFVPPELVLAARVYGLGPAEAAQAARLAVSGSGQLVAMASAVDRTFVQAMALEAERRSDRGRLVTAYPVGDSDALGATPAAAPEHARTATTFGVDRRAPRGAFLWPAATTAALGLSAPTPDGDHAASIAALELLAARTVAELGTYSVLGELDRGGERAPAAVPAQTGGEGAAVPSAEPRDEDVLAAASAFVPAARRDKFHALYVALGQSASGRTWSPAARAARALALAGRGEDTISARERAAVAWDVLPAVYGIGEMRAEGTLSTGEAAARDVRRREELRALEPVFVDARPGLSALSTRAGEALGAYVAPAAAAAVPSTSSSAPRELGAVLRSPTAAPELVETGRPAGRFGGGEVEIPAWFEEAAKKMFAERSSTSIADGISIAELTLITTAPARQIAASTREHGSAPPPTVAPAQAAAQPADVDIEQVANDVYREVLVLMDVARARNGEPYL